MSRPRLQCHIYTVHSPDRVQVSEGKAHLDTEFRVRPAFLPQERANSARGHTEHFCHVVNCEVQILHGQPGVPALGVFVSVFSFHGHEFNLLVAPAVAPGRRHVLVIRF